MPCPQLNGSQSAVKAKKAGFSLIELSIVLVILGLLTGGIITGQSLIRASELRSITTESQRYQTAVMSFRDKYFSLPGDFPNATKFWGQDDGCSSYHDAGTVDSTTCNGDGDGRIYNYPGNNAPSVEYHRESHWAWHHMANAGLIEGNYGGHEATMQEGSNGIAKMNSAQFRLIHWPSFPHNEKYYNLDYGLHLEFSHEQTNSGVTIPIITPEEAWGIDQKADDGKPGTGKIRSVGGGHHHSNGAQYCTTSTNVNTSEYNIARATETLCVIMFRF